MNSIQQDLTKKNEKKLKKSFTKKKFDDVQINYNEISTKLDVIIQTKVSKSKNNDKYLQEVNLLNKKIMSLGNDMNELLSDENFNSPKLKELLQKQKNNLDFKYKFITTKEKDQNDETQSELLMIKEKNLKMENEIKILNHKNKELIDENQKLKIIQNPKQIDEHHIEEPKNDNKEMTSLKEKIQELNNFKAIQDSMNNISSQLDKYQLQVKECNMDSVIQIDNSKDDNFDNDLKSFFDSSMENLQNEPLPENEDMKRKIQDQMEELNKRYQNILMQNKNSKENINQMNKLYTSGEELKDERKKLRSKEKRLSKKITNLQGNIQDLKSNNLDLQSENNGLIKQVKDLEKFKKDVQLGFDISNSNLLKEKESLNIKIDELNKQIEIITKNSDETNNILNKEKDDLNKIIANLNKEIKNLKVEPETDNSNGGKEKEDLLLQIEEFKTKIESQINNFESNLIKERQQLKKTVHGISKQIDIRNQDIQKQVEDLKKEKDELNKQIKSIEEINLTENERKIQDEEDEQFKNLWKNFDLVPEEIPGIGQVIFGKYFRKRNDLEHKFRNIIETVVNIGNETLYLFQDQKINQKIIQQINDFIIFLNGTLEKLLHEINIGKKVYIITHFYHQNKIIPFKEMLITNLFPLVDNFRNNFRADEKIKQKLFQDFNQNDGEIDFDTFKAINSPNDYESIVDESIIDDYDRFVSVSNLIISIGDLIKFESEYRKMNSEISTHEELMTKEFFDELPEEKRNVIKAQVKVNLLKKSKKDKSQKMDTKINILKKRKEELEQGIQSLQKDKIDLEKNIDEKCKELMVNANNANDKAKKKNEENTSLN